MWLLGRWSEERGETAKTLRQSTQKSPEIKSLTLKGDGDSVTGF
jgi:hypothetical protein